MPARFKMRVHGEHEIACHRLTDGAQVAQGQGAIFVDGFGFCGQPGLAHEAGAALPAMRSGMVPKPTPGRVPILKFLV